MRKWSVVAVSIVALAAVAALVAVLSHEPPGPVPIVWDKTACAGCRMHIGEPAFAAQIQTRDGRVLDFDDPGCLLAYVIAEDPPIEAAFFRHVDRDAWLSLADVGFVEHPRTPMGYGLAAVEREHVGALSYEQALERIKKRARAVGSAR